MSNYSPSGANKFGNKQFHQIKIFQFPNFTELDHSKFSFDTCKTKKILNSSSALLHFFFLYLQQLSIQNPVREKTIRWVTKPPTFQNLRKIEK